MVPHKFGLVHHMNATSAGGLAPSLGTTVPRLFGCDLRHRGTLICIAASPSSLWLHPTPHSISRVLWCLPGPPCLAADGTGNLKIRNCAKTPGTHYFFGHPTHQISTPWKILWPRKMRAGSEQRPRSAQELFEQAVVEWEEIPQETIDDWIQRMTPDANGAHKVVHRSR